MRFTQAIRVRCGDPESLMELLAEWDVEQSKSEIMGYIGNRLLADRDQPGEYTILAEFAEVDGDLSAADEAELNNQRKATERWAEKLLALVDGEPEWIHFDELYRTGITGNIRTR
jgi:hypothetical protein